MWWYIRLRISNYKSKHTLVTLEAIAKRHIEWIKIAKYIGASNDEADDMVQSMYLKLAA
jgi:hypothetical protein